MKKQTLIFLFFCFSLIMACSGPMYEPGMMTGKDVVVPPGNSIYETEGYWQLNETIRVFYFSKGEGVPVLMIHGGPGNPFAAYWKGLDSLCNNYRFFYYHQRGCGNSTMPVESYKSKNYFSNLLDLQANLGMETQLEDIERIRKILGEDQIILIGHSYGGLMASLYAIEYPGNVRAMILVSPADLIVMPSPTGGLYERVKNLLPEDMKDEYNDYLERFFDYKHIFTKNEEELSDLNNEFIQYYQIACEVTGDKAYMPDPSVRFAGWHMHALSFSVGKKHNYSDAYREISIPTLVIHGKNDIMPVEASMQYTDLISGSKIKVIEGAGHFSFDAQPEEFGRVVGEFLERLK